MGKYMEASIKTKENIKDAFWEIYQHKRIDKITVNEITLKAGYNRSTFYQYFKDVYDVLDYIEDSLFPDFNELPISILDNAFDKFFVLYNKGSKYCTKLLGDTGDPRFISRIKESIKSSIMKSLNSCDLELDYNLEFLLSGLIGVLSYWYKNGENISKERLVSLISSYIDKR